MASKKPSGLGRGLGALLGDDAVKAESSGSLYLPISQVESCSSQPRKHFDPESLQELADSITEHGIIQPLTVRRLASGYYQIIAGERRWRAARLAGLTEVPVIVMEADDRKAAELAMIENLQREDLNPMEEAAGFQALIESYHMTQDEAAQRVDITIDIDYHETGEHFREQFSEYSYTLDTVRALLEKYGFAVARVADGEDFGPVRADSPRWIITAVKQYTQEGEKINGTES